NATPKTKGRAAEASRTMQGLLREDESDQEQFTKGLTPAEARAKAEADAADRAVSRPWIMDFKGVKGISRCTPYYDLNHDAFDGVSTEKVNGLLQTNRYAVLATIWEALTTILEGARETVLKALDEQKLLDTPEAEDALDALVVIPISSGSDWVLIKTPSSYFQSLLVEQRNVYHQQLQTTVFFRPVEFNPRGSRLIRATIREDDMGGLTEAAIGIMIMGDLATSRGIIRKIKSRGRFAVPKGGRSVEIIYEIELEKGKEAEMGDLKHMLRIADGTVIRDVLVGHSPYCKGCKSRNHTLFGCPWLATNLRLDNNYANRVTSNPTGRTFASIAAPSNDDPKDAQSESNGTPGEDSRQADVAMDG
ncbi:hypothetical protein TRAPUB_12820, partial [Trametes pubescens]